MPAGRSAAEVALDKHVGARVRTRRMMLTMSQEDLGDAVSLTFQQIQKYEKGTNRIGASRLLSIARVLKVPVAFFFEGAPGGDSSASATPTVVTDLLASPSGFALAKAFVRIKSGHQRALLVSIASEFASEEEAAEPRLKVAR